MAALTTKEWILACFSEKEMADRESVASSFQEELADTPEELLFVNAEEIEDLMSDLKLKTKTKAKMRRAIKDLREANVQDAVPKPNPRLAVSDDDDDGPSPPGKKAGNSGGRKLVASPTPGAVVVSNDRQKAAPAPVGGDRPVEYIDGPVRGNTLAMALAESGTEAEPMLCQPIQKNSAGADDQVVGFRRDVPKYPGTFVVPTIRKTEMSGPWKTIMVVGETGCGKTTTLNSMVNYLWGVQLEDHFRFVLVPPPSDTAAQAHSVTSDVTSYFLRPPRLPYGLTIVDTPGFGDTKGFEADKEIVEKIEHTFRYDIETLDGIFFIVRSSGRLDSQMKYVFNSVLRLFGRDLVRNLFTLITFADGAIPPVLASIRAANIPAQQNFELNNSAFFNGFEPDKAYPLAPHMCYQPGETVQKIPSPKGLLDRPHTKMFWEMGNQAMDKLFDALSCTEPCSLQLSVGTLELRKKLQLKIVHLQQQVSNGLDKIASLRDFIDTIKRNAREIESSRDFVIKGTKNELYKENTGKNNTTCTNCKHTCHADCAFSKNQDKVSCIAITNEFCTICTGKCHWTAHINEKFVLKTRVVETTTTRDEMKKKFDKSNSEMSFAEQAVIVLSNEVMDEQQMVKASVDELREAIAELGRIAMRPSVMEEEDYYDKLIETEEAQKDPGWRERVIALSELKEQAMYVRTVMSTNSGADAGVVIFKSAMDQLRKDLAEIRAIMGAGHVESAKNALGNIADSVSQVGRNLIGGRSAQAKSGKAAPRKNLTLVIFGGRK